MLFDMLVNKLKKNTVISFETLATSPDQIKISLNLLFFNYCLTITNMFCSFEPLLSTTYFPTYGAERFLFGFGCNYENLSTKTNSYFFPIF